VQGVGSTNAGAEAHGTEATSGGGASERRGGGGHIGVVEGMAPPALSRGTADLTSGGAGADGHQDFTRSRAVEARRLIPIRE